jgi:hypothetical protein
MSSIKKEMVYGIEYLNEKGLLHREDGPAREYKNGTKAWRINGQLHRTDGPAIERKDGTKFWYLNDKRYSEQDWKQEVAKIKLKRILDL